MVDEAEQDLAADLGEAEVAGAEGVQNSSIGSGSAERMRERRGLPRGALGSVSAMPPPMASLNELDEAVGEVRAEAALGATHAEGAVSDANEDESGDEEASESVSVFDRLKRQVKLLRAELLENAKEMADIRFLAFSHQIR